VAANFAKRIHQDYTCRQINLTPRDAACLEGLAVRLGLTTRVGALRMALRRQADRDRSGPPPESVRRVYGKVLAMADLRFRHGITPAARVKPAAAGKPVKVPGPMTFLKPKPAGTRQYTFWLSAVDVAIIDAVSRRYLEDAGTGAAVRFVLRVEAAMEGVNPEAKQS
jgi:hypothetical protein